MDILELFYQGYFDVIMETFNVDDILISGDIVKIYFYMRCVSKFNRYDLLDVIFSHLKDTNTEDSNIVYDLGVLSWIPQQYTDLQDEFVSQLKASETSNIDLKLIMLERLIFYDNGLNTTSRSEKFFTYCKELGLDKSRVYLYNKATPDKNTQPNFFKKLCDITLLTHNFENVKNIIEDDIIKKHYNHEELRLLRFKISLYNGEDIDIDELINTISKCAMERNKIFPFDSEPVILVDCGNKLRILGFPIYARKLFDRFKDICPRERFDCLSYKYLCFIKDYRSIIEWIERHVISKRVPGPNTIVDYMSALVNLGEFKKYEEAYEKWHDIAVTSKSQLCIFIYKHVRMGYLLATHQIQTVNELNILIDTNVSRICPNSLAYYNNIRNEIMTKTAVIKARGFDIIENYNIDDPSGCFDHNNTLICSVCLDEIVNSKVTLIVCSHCKKYVGHMLCLYEWINNKPSCPLCRC